MEPNSDLILTDEDAIYTTANALASKARLEILRVCREKFLSISDLSSLLSLPQSTVTNHVQTLEEAGLIETRSEAGKRGRQKLCRSTHNTVFMTMPGSSLLDPSVVEVDMPVGLFTKVQVSPPCGLASPARTIGQMDFPESFLLPERISAGLVWFEDGWVEYSFPRNFPPDSVVESLDISFEVCSEAVNYNEDWPSDISVWINSVIIGTWTCPGDFGDLRGALNPSWWPAIQSQYGHLKTFTVADDGTFLDGEKISDCNLSRLDITDSPTFKLRIGIDKSARNKGGANIFGNTFGNYEQGIKVLFRLKEK